MDELILKRLLLQKLVRGNVWGGKHTPFDFIKRGIPDIYRNTPQGKRNLERALKELLNDELILVLLKKTGKGSGQHVSLNPRKVSEIKQLLEKSQ